MTVYQIKINKRIQYVRVYTIVKRLIKRDNFIVRWITKIATKGEDY